MIIEAETKDEAWRIFLDLIKRKATIKELKGTKMNFIEYLRTIHLGGVVNDCKIECRGDSIYCGAMDQDETMKLESSWKGRINGLREGEAIAIFDVKKLISMISNPKAGDNIWIESDDLSGKLHYEAAEEKVDYTLMDPELIDEANIEKTIESFLKEEAIEFILTPYEMKKIMEKSRGVSSEFIRFYTDNGFVKVEIGEMDKLSTEVGEYKRLIEDVDSVSLYLDSRIISSIFKIGIQLQGTIRMFIKTDFPAVIKLENIGQAINVAYLTSPSR
jgi:hypothetical protein